MKQKAKIRIRGAHMDLIARALIPDNMKNMRTDVQGESAATYFEAPKIGTLIASMDDYLMNAHVAQNIVKLVEMKDHERA